MALNCRKASTSDNTNKILISMPRGGRKKLFRFQSRETNLHREYLCDMHQLSTLFSGLIYGFHFPNKRQLDSHLAVEGSNYAKSRRGREWECKREREATGSWRWKTRRERNARECFSSFRSNYFPWFSLRNNLDEHCRILGKLGGESRDKGYPLLSSPFFLVFSFSSWWKNC